MATDGQTVLVTRARGQNTELRRLLEGFGFEVVEIPTIEIREPDSWEPVDLAARDLGRYEWILFTSANAVDAFVARTHTGRLGRVAVVGSQTARRARSLGIDVALVPKEYRSEGLLAALPKTMTGVSVLLPRGDLADDVLPQALRDRGARVDTVTVYRTAVPSEGRKELRELLRENRLDCISFTSGSTVRNLIRMLDVPDPAAWLSGPAIAVIGPVTRRIATELGLTVRIEPEAATMKALATSIRNFLDP